MNSSLSISSCVSRRTRLVTSRSFWTTSVVIPPNAAGPDKSDEKRYTYVWIYENGAKELKSRPLSGRFVLSKGDNTKIKGKVGPFFLPVPVYLLFIALLSLYFARLHGLEAP